jgi:hypothetical protein
MICTFLLNIIRMIRKGGLGRRDVQRAWETGEINRKLNRNTCTGDTTTET